MRAVRILGSLTIFLFVLLSVLAQGSISINPGGLLQPGQPYAITITGTTGQVTCTFSDGGVGYGGSIGGLAPDAYDASVGFSCSDEGGWSGGGSISTVSQTLVEPPEVPVCPPEGCPPDPCTVDTDGDGVTDCYDGCPTVAGTQNGCPSDPSCTVDADGDRVMDCNDSCPAVAANTQNGCPELDKCTVDTDGDGVTDCYDSCPTVPGRPEDGCIAPTQIPGPSLSPKSQEPGTACQLKPSNNSITVWGEPNVNSDAISSVNRRGLYNIQARVDKPNANGDLITWYLVNNGEVSGWVSETTVAVGGYCAETLTMPADCPAWVLQGIAAVSEVARTAFASQPDPCAAYIEWAREQGSDDFIRVNVPNMDNLLENGCPEVMPEMIRLMYRYRDILPPAVGEELFAAFDARLAAADPCEFARDIIQNRRLSLDSSPEVLNAALPLICNRQMEATYYDRIRTSLDALGLTPEEFDAAVKDAKQSGYCNLVNNLGVAGVTLADNPAALAVYRKLRQCSTTSADAAMYDVATALAIYADMGDILARLNTKPDPCADFKALLQDVDIAARAKELYKTMPVELAKCPFVVVALFEQHRAKMKPEDINRLIKHPTPCHAVTDFLNTGYLPPVLSVFIESQLSVHLNRQLNLPVDANATIKIYRPAVGTITVGGGFLTYTPAALGVYVFQYELFGADNKPTVSVRVIVTVVPANAPTPPPGRVSPPAMPGRPVTVSVPFTSCQVKDRPDLKPILVNGICTIEFPTPEDASGAEIISDGPPIKPEPEPVQPPLPVFPILLPLQAESSIAVFRWQADENAAGDIYVMKDGQPHQLSTNTGDEQYPAVSSHGDSVLYIQENAGVLSITQHGFEFFENDEQKIEIRGNAPVPILEGTVGGYGLNNIPAGSTIDISGITVAPDGTFALVPLRQDNGQVNLHELTINANGSATLDAEPLIENAQYPAIQPSGNLVTFERGGQIWMLFKQSGEIVNLSHPPDPETPDTPRPADTDTCLGASFNADGTEIYFTCTDTNQVVTIWHYNTLGVYQKLPVVNDVGVCPKVQFGLAPGYFACVSDTANASSLWFARPGKRGSVFWEEEEEFNDVIISQFNWVAEILGDADQSE